MRLIITLAYNSPLTAIVKRSYPFSNSATQNSLLYCSNAPSHTAMSMLFTSSATYQLLAILCLQQPCHLRSSTDFKAQPCPSSSQKWVTRKHSPGQPLMQPKTMAGMDYDTLATNKECRNVSNSSNISELKQRSARCTRQSWIVTN